MTRNLTTRSGLVLLSLLLPLAPLRAEEAVPRELLRDALYAEEVSRDVEKAAENYQKVLALYDEQQPVAAAALFRLAEVRRKQGNKDEAVRLYQRLIREFPAAETEGKLALENLTALGAKGSPNPSMALVDEEAQELQRIRELAISSPDRVRDQVLAEDAVAKGRIRVIEYLLNSGFVAEPKSLLADAVISGNVRMVETLLSKSGALTRPEGQEVLWGAVGRGYKEVALVLLKQKIDPNFLKDDGKRLSDGTMREDSPLHLAVRKGDAGMCHILLDHGADPNLAPPNCSYPGDERYAFGSALHEAARKSEELVRLLIEKGGKADLAAPGTGLTPLHIAAAMNQPGIVKLLLEKGVPVDAGSLQVMYPSSESRSAEPAGQTPLMMAVGRGALESAKLLLEKGADANAQDGFDRPVIYRALWSTRVPALRLLLEHKADPNIRFGELNLSSSGEANKDPFRSGTTPRAAVSEPLILKAATREKNNDAVKTLLDAGAEPGAELAWIVRSVAKYDADGSLVRRLVSYHKGGINLEELPAMEDWTPEAKIAFLESAVYPALSGEKQFKLLFPTTGRVTPIEGDLPRPQAPALAQLLLSQSEALLNDRNGRLQGITIVRKEGEGKWTRLPVDLKADSPFPELQRGDAIEVATSSPRQSQVVPVQEANSGTLWALRRRVSFPITTEIDGKSREVVIRGDNFTFDPSKAEVPWFGASNLAALLWRPEIHPELGKRPSVTLVRSGWPDVRIPWGQKGPSDLSLEPGDKLVIRSEPADENARQARLAQISIVSGGLPFSDYILGQTSAFGGWVPGTCPTLLQVLAELIQGNPAGLEQAPDSPEALARWLIQVGKEPMLLLPHPDYSRIRIRRLQQDGTEQIIPVDLAAAISASSDQTTPLQAREADIPLQPGDIVDVPILEGKAGQAWKGPSEKEEAFFAKALGCRVQIQSSDGKIELNEISYRAPRFVPAGSSYIPLPPLSGTSSLRASRLLPNSNPVGITRAGDSDTDDMVPPAQVFLRDGDLLEVTAQQGFAVPQGVPQGVRPPRPRIVPPPPAR